MSLPAGRSECKQLIEQCSFALIKIELELHHDRPAKQGIYIFPGGAISKSMTMNGER